MEEILLSLKAMSSTLKNVIRFGKIGPIFSKFYENLFAGRKLRANMHARTRINLIRIKFHLDCQKNSNFFEKIARFIPRIFLDFFKIFRKFSKILEFQK